MVRLFTHDGLQINYTHKYIVHNNNTGGLNGEYVQLRRISLKLKQIREEVTFIVKRKLDLREEDMSCYSRVITRLSLCIEKIALEEAYLWR